MGEALAIKASLTVAHIAVKVCGVVVRPRFPFPSRKAFVVYDKREPWDPSVPFVTCRWRIVCCSVCLFDVGGQDSEGTVKAWVSLCDS